MIKMRLNQSERARLTALAQHYNLPASHAGFCLALYNAIAEMTGDPPRWGREDATTFEPDAPPDYLNLAMPAAREDALADIARRAGTAGAPWKKTIFFVVNTVLYQSAEEARAAQHRETARRLEQIDSTLDAPTTARILAQFEAYDHASGGRHV